MKGYHLMLKLIAALLMVLDHFALIFLLPSTSLYTLCRFLGRLSMPLFAYLLALGFTRTKHFKSYMNRIFLMTLMAQVPFTWLIYGDAFFFELQATGVSCLFQYWNIGLTFLAALLLLKLIRDGSSVLFVFKALGVAGCLFLGYFGDYGLYGVGMILLFYTYHTLKLRIIDTGLLMVLLTLCYSLMYGASWQSIFISQFPAVLSLFLLAFVKDRKLSLPKYFFYWFYPVHMLLLLFLHLILGN